MQKKGDGIAMKHKRLKTFLFFTLSKLPMKGQTRCRFVKWGGVDCKDDHSFIGQNCVFDTIHPEFIHIGEKVHITSGVCILTHLLITDLSGIHWRYGHVYIGDRSFIGMGTIIAKDVKIGSNCIIGAGSVVTKDIPDNEIWAGNPARFIKKRVIE